MKTIAFIFLGFIFCNVVFAQKGNFSGKAKKMETLYVVKFEGSKTQVTTRNLVIDYSRISDLHLVPKDEATTIYKAPEGTAVFITTVKLSVQLLTAKKLFTKYNLLSKMKYPVQIDGYMVKEPKKILADVAAIESVRFNATGKFIEIRSKLYAKNLKKGLPDRMGNIISKSKP